MIDKGRDKVRGIRKKCAVTHSGAEESERSMHDLHQRQGQRNEKAVCMTYSRVKDRGIRKKCA